MQNIIELSMDLEIMNEPKNDTSILFTDIEITVKYCLLHEMIPKIRICENCNSVSRICSYVRYLNQHAYRCTNSDCRKYSDILSEKYITKPKISLNLYFHCIYKWLQDVPEKNVLNNVKISKKSFQKIKENIFKYLYSNYIANTKIKIGSARNSVQIDETAICHGKLSTFPSNLKDDSPGITWLVGMIEQNTGNFRYEVVPNRKHETFEILIKKYINPDTLIITDGYPSYPKAIYNLKCKHVIINHSLGFKNSEGFHTNNIENLWSLIKYVIKKRRGVNKNNIDNFLYEFFYRYNNLRNNTTEQIKKCWDDIIMFLFKMNHENINKV